MDGYDEDFSFLVSLPLMRSFRISFWQGRSRTSNARSKFWGLIQKIEVLSVKGRKRGEEQHAIVYVQTLSYSSAPLYDIMSCSFFDESEQQNMAHRSVLFCFNSNERLHILDIRVRKKENLYPKAPDVLCRFLSPM
jgi:hypothetical protein